MESKTNDQLTEIIGLLKAVVLKQQSTSDELQSKITELQKQVKLLKYGDGAPNNW